MKLVQKIIILFIYFIIFAFLFTNYFSISVSSLKISYSVLLCSYLICGVVFLITVFNKNYYIFEPYTLVALLYVAIMIYRPCLDIINGNYYKYGVYIMSGCTKATIVFTVSFIAFSFAYNFKIVNKSKIKSSNRESKERNCTKLSDYSVYYTKRLRIICISIFFIGLILVLIYYKTAGYNPIAFLKNLKQSEDTYLFNSNFKFLSKCSFLMIIPWLFISSFDKSKFLRAITTIFLFTVLLIAGARYIIIISIIAKIVLPYICEKKSFAFKKGIIVFLILIVLCDVIAYIRTDARKGNSVDFSNMSSMIEITDVFDSDFTIYKPFYCVVEKVPYVLPYQMGKGLIGYSIVSFLPRFLFPWKSEFDIMADSIEAVMNKTARKSGLAMPNIGEFYLEFGVIGCIICMYIFGIICKNLKKLYMNEKNGINELILYSVLFPFLMQIVCRGYLSIQLNSLLFIVLPYFLIRYELKKQKQVVR